MPQIPHAGFTARQQGIGQGLAAGPRSRTASPEDFGAGAGRELQRAGAGLRQTVHRGISILEERESRTLKVESAKLAAAFSEELNAAVTEGRDLDAVQDKYNDALAELGGTLQTAKGHDEAQLIAARGNKMFGEAVRSAKAQRVALDTQEQTAEFLNILGNDLVNNPAGLENALQSAGEFVDTFSNLSPERRAKVKRDLFNDLALSAGNGLLLQDPGSLKSLLTKGEGIPHLTPAQTASFISKAEAELSRLDRESKTKDEMGKLITRQALATEAEDHVLTNEEAPLWFERGVTAAQFESARQDSIEAAEERQALAVNAATIQAGGGSVFSQTDYEAALAVLVDDATKGLEEQEAVNTAVNLRITSALKNGRQDSKLKALLNAGPLGEEEAFAVGYEIRRRLNASSVAGPPLLNAMLSEDARRMYNVYDHLRGTLSLSHEAARQRLFDIREAQPEVAKRLANEDMRDLIDDAVNDLVDSGEAVTQIPIMRKQIKERAIMYMALEPLMGNEAAVELARKDLEDTTVEINDFRVSAAGVPPRWRDADNYARRIVLKRDLEAAGQEVPQNVRVLDKLHIFPNGDGTAAVINPDTGLTIFPAWDWTGAVNEWWIERGLAEEGRRAELIESEHKRRQERRRSIQRQQDDFVGVP